MRRRITLLLVAGCLLLGCVTGQAQTDTRQQRPRVGLALGGGGAKGAAEVGVLKVIEEVGVPIDYIAGTSIGAIVGALYSVGWRAEQLDSLFRSQAWVDMFVNGEVTESLERLAARPDEMDFSKLPIPFACVAVDVRTQQEVVLRQGVLVQAIRASMAVPGIFKAVKIDGRTLVDGGMMNNLPVDVVKEMGADIVIAVDLTQNKHSTRHFSLKSLIGIGGILDWAVSRPDWKKLNDNRRLADVLINPQLAGYDATDFNRVDISTMILLGEDAAREKKQQLLGLKRQLEEGKAIGR